MTLIAISKNSLITNNRHDIPILVWLLNEYLDRAFFMIAKRLIISSISSVSSNMLEFWDEIIALYEDKIR